MPERKRKWRIFLLHIILLPTVMYVFYFFTLGPKPYTGVDEAVVEKIAKEHGREASPPLINTEGDMLLFVFLLAGAVGGFAAGYAWRVLVSEKKVKTPPDDAGPKG
ncbi:cobalt ABC transporter permease [Geobacter luticola]|uniref:Cobalt ABC transporter permease n=1 Tax=Geomobilimonas luticola TaxID=1114878 RepID=A0ABS5SA12_9BACT|nr:cobalt ABC transporter permease [Geomobilimonas luticola]